MNFVLRRAEVVQQALGVKRSAGPGNGNKDSQGRVERRRPGSAARPRFQDWRCFGVLAKNIIQRCEFVPLFLTGLKFQNKLEMQRF